MRGFKLSAIAAAAATGIFAIPALAQTTEEQPFSGIYVGGSVGYDVQGNDTGSILQFDRNLDGGFNENVTTATGANAFSTGFCNGAATSSVSTTGCRNDKDRISYYARVGFDKQFGAIVVGALGEFGKSDITDSVSAFSTTPASYTFTREVEWEASARLRAGFAAKDTLFYGTGGGGYVSIENSFTTSNGLNAFSGNGDNNKEFGFIVGGGLEQKIGKNFSIGMEYTYHDYKDKDYAVRVSQGTAPATNPFILPPNTTGTDIRRSDNNFRWHSLRATAAFRF